MIVFHFTILSRCVYLSSFTVTLLYFCALFAVCIISFVVVALMLCVEVKVKYRKKSVSVALCNVKKWKKKENN